jgi:hypothetical protein
MGTVAAARRTQASFAAYLASTSPTVLTGVYGPGPGGSAGYDPVLVGKISRLPDVKRVESYAGLDAAVLAPSGAVRFNVMGWPGTPTRSRPAGRSSTACRTRRSSPA